MQIKIFNNNKKLNKFLLKTILKETKLHNNFSLGIGYENGILPFFKVISDYKKIRWNNIKIISLIEYFDHQSTMFYALMQKEFISKLTRFNSHNFFNKIEDIKNLKDLNNLNNLYNEKIDLGIFFLDFRGNFLLNDYESKCNYIHISTNGDKIISPGLKSILSFSKIIIISNDENSQKVLNKLTSKKIDEDEPFTFLNFHRNSILLTLSSLLSKKNIVKSINSSDVEKWSKKIFKDNQNFETNNNLNDISGDKYIDDKLDETFINSEKSLDKELEEALKTINEETEIESDISDEINLEYTNEVESDVIIDDSLMNNLNQDYSNEIDNFDKDLYGSDNAEDINLFESNNLSNHDINSEISLNNLNMDMHNVADENEHTHVYDLEDKIGNKDDMSDLPTINDNIYSGHSILLEEDNKENEHLSSVPAMDSKLSVNDKPSGSLHIKEELNSNVKQFSKFNDHYLYKKEDIQILESKPFVSEKKPEIKRNNIDEINYLRRIIKIKEDTLQTIESLQYLNSGFSKNIKEETIQFKYIPGNRPTPMIAIYDTPNIGVFENIKDLMIKSIEDFSYESSFINEYKHFWNHGAYLIYDEDSLEIKSLLFSDFSTLIFLLRSINKDLWFNITKSMELFFDNELKIFIDEFSLSKK